MPWFDISAVGSKYFTYSSYKPCIVSEKYYLCTVLIRPKAPMGRGRAGKHNGKRRFVRFGFDELESRKFIDKSRAKQQRMPHEVYDVQPSLTSITLVIVVRVFLYTYTGVGAFGVARFDLSGNARASIRGTSDRSGSTLFRM